MSAAKRPNRLQLGVSLALAGLFMQPSMTFAQIDRRKAPEPGPAPQVTIGDHTAMDLPNGMKMIVVEDHRLPMVSVEVRFDQPPHVMGDLAAVPDLMGELLGAGTQWHTKAEIDESIDRLGARLSSGSNGVYAASLKKHFDKLLPIVFEVTARSTFPAEEFNKARDRYLSALKQREDDPDAIADEVARTLAYGKGHPYGEVVTPELVDKAARKHVAAYHKFHFRPEQGYLVFVGDITPAEARKLADRSFANWEVPEVVTDRSETGRISVDGLGELRLMLKVPRAGGVRSVSIVDRPGAPQSVVRVTFPVELNPADPRAAHAQVMNTILGGGVFNARLMQNLREDKAFTYGAYCSLQADRYVGRYTASTSVRTDVTDSAITEIMYEMERIREAPVTEEELTLVKNYLAGSFARSLEDPRTVARMVLRTYIDGLPPDHYDTYLQRLEAVTAEDVRRAAMVFLNPDQASVLVVGDKSAIGNRITPLSYRKSLAQLDVHGDPYREEVLPAPPGMTAEQVVEKYLEACGGSPTIAGIRDLHMRMTATMQGIPVTVDQYFSVPGKRLTVMRANGQELQREVLSDGRAQRTSPAGTEDIIEMELEDMVFEAHPFPEERYAERGRMVLPGVVDLDGRKAYKVVMMADNGNGFTEYYDMESGFKLRREEFRTTAQGNLNIVTEYQDYRPENGIQFPHLIEQVAGMRMVLTVKEVAVNEGLDPALFEFEE